MQSARRWVLAASVVILVPGAVPQAPADDPEVAEGLSRLERAVELAPDDLQLGNTYRMAVIRSDETERAIEFLSGLLERHQQSNPLRINLALAYVDRLSRPGTSRTARADWLVDHWTNSTPCSSVIRPTGLRSSRGV